MILTVGMEWAWLPCPAHSEMFKTSSPGILFSAGYSNIVVIKLRKFLSSPSFFIVKKKSYVSTGLWFSESSKRIKINILKNIMFKNQASKFFSWTLGKMCKVNNQVKRMRNPLGHWLLPSPCQMRSLWMWRTKWRLQEREGVSAAHWRHTAARVGEGCVLWSRIGVRIQCDLFSWHHGLR